MEYLDNVIVYKKKQLFLPFGLKGNRADNKSEEILQRKMNDLDVDVFRFERPMQYY